MPPTGAARRPLRERGSVLRTVTAPIETIGGPTPMRGIIVFLAILLLGGGFFWALVGGCVAS